MTVRQRFWLCLPPVLACGFDVAATLLGQGPRDWAGDYGSARELNPLAAPLLAHHPAAFAGAASAWAAAVAVLSVAWRSPLAVVVAFAVTLGHAIGAAAWMAAVGPIGYAGAAAWLFAASNFTGFSWRQAGVDLRPGHAGPTRLG